MLFKARVRRAVASIGAGAVVVIGASLGVALSAGVASAHVPTVTAGCQSLDVVLVNYNKHGVNSVTVAVDGATLVDHVHFANSYTDSVTWTSYGAHTYSVDVTAWDDPTGSNGWTKSFAGTSTPCTTQAISTAPAFADPSCQDSSGHVSIPDVTGAQYAIDGTDVGPGDHPAAAGSSTSVAVRATSAQYTLTGDVGPWQHTFATVGDCTTHVTPKSPSLAQGTCTSPGQQGDGSITLPSQTGVVYKIDGVVRSGSANLGPGTYHVTAEPADHTITLDGTKAWDLTLNSVDCTSHATPATPNVTQAVCSGPGQQGRGAITLVPVTGVLYSLDGAQKVASGTFDVSAGPHAVDAFPAAGYVLNGTSHFDTDIAVSDCLAQDNPTTPWVSQATCDGTPGGITSASLTIPTVVGADYLVNGVKTGPGIYAEPAGSYTVTAAPQPGYSFGSKTAQWVLSIKAAPVCKTSVAPVQPSVTQFACTKTADKAMLASPTYTIPDTAGVDYLVSGDVVPAGTYPASPGALRVSAQPQAGYAFAAGARSTWRLAFHRAPTCVLSERFHRSVPPTQSLPFTGLSIPIAQTVVAALLAIGAGTALTVVGLRRRRLHQVD